MHGEDWRSDDDRKIDLELENKALELDLKLQGATFRVESDIDPELENSFLNYVKDFEELDKLPKVKLTSLFPPGFTFPPADELTREELENKLDDILDILEEHNIYLELANDVPDDVVYTYLAHDYILREDTFPDNNIGINHIISGCTGWCPDCFQREYCEVCRENWTKKELERERLKGGTEENP
ncbi:MAG: hypothetical protein GF350_07040 [Chitinivibrionales bacterium]|nr:hypothetical protein [Chitinivibrionales bacterium]